MSTQLEAAQPHAAQTPTDSEIPLTGQTIQQAYAAFALYLDIHYVLQGDAQCDFEHIVIYACIAEATLRPHLDGRAISTDPPTYSGSISRLLVADRVALPRETVRRKIAAMISAGLLEAKGRDSVSIAPKRFSKRAREIHAAVGRYQQRTNTAPNRRGA